jgi:hypothetical protein
LSTVVHRHWTGGPRGCGKLTTKPVILKLVAAQKAAAAAHELCFWNTFGAMGGEGSMGKWVNAKPQLGSYDFTHPPPLGAEAIATLLFNALDAGYAAYASAHPGEPGVLAVHSEERLAWDQGSRNASTSIPATCCAARSSSG